MTHPYSDLGGTAFWRSGVAEADPAAPVDLYRPKFALGRDAAIATAGSCFAQHVGRALRDAGMNVLDAEPPPLACPDPVARAYGFGIYSGRYGNIYTARQLAQLIADAQAGHVDPTAIWPRAGRFHDALRPTIEPGGFVSVEEVRALRQRGIRVAAVFMGENASAPDARTIYGQDLVRIQRMDQLATAAGKLIQEEIRELSG